MKRERKQKPTTSKKQEKEAKPHGSQGYSGRLQFLSFYQYYMHTLTNKPIPWASMIKKATSSSSFSPNFYLLRERRGKTCYPIKRMDEMCTRHRRRRSRTMERQHTQSNRQVRNLTVEKGGDEEIHELRNCQTKTTNRYQQNKRKKTGHETLSIIRKEASGGWNKALAWSVLFWWHTKLACPSFSFEINEETAWWAGNFHFLLFCCFVFPPLMSLTPSDRLKEDTISIGSTSFPVTSSSSSLPPLSL